MTTQLPAPKSVINLVKCNCSKSRCQTARCTCRFAGLFCTDMCGCSNMEDNCDNWSAVHDEDEELEELDVVDDDSDDLFV